MTIELSVEGLKDFQTCALLYDFRHLEKRYETTNRHDELAVRFANTMEKIVSFFFYKRQGGVLPSVAALLNRWEKNWFPKDMTAYDLAVEQHNVLGGNLASFSSEGVRSLLRFYDDFAYDRDRDPLLINEAFTIPLADNIRLQGNFDLVLRDRNGSFTVIKWLTSTKRTAASSMVLDFAALKMAFDYRNDGKDMNVRYGYYDLVSAGNFGFHPVEVEDDDVNALVYWAQEATSTQVFAPRRGLTSQCKTCVFDSPCRDWSMTDKMLEISKQSWND